MLLLAFAALVVLSWRRADIRAFALLLGAPLVLLTISMASTYSVPTAAPYRTPGGWVVLSLPFAAWAIVRGSRRVSSSQALQAVTIVLLTCICVAPLGLRARSFAQGGRRQSGALADDALSHRLRTILREDRRQVLIDVIDNLDYLGVIVRSGAPRRFVADVDADPTAVADYAAQRAYYVGHHDRSIVSRYLTDRFGLGSGLRLGRLRARNIGFLLVHNRRFVLALDRTPSVVPMQAFGGWKLFKVGS